MSDKTKTAANADGTLTNGGDELQSLRDALAKSQGNLADADALISSLKSQLGDKSEIIVDLEKKLADSESAIAEMEKQLISLQEALIKDIPEDEPVNSIAFAQPKKLEELPAIKIGKKNYKFIKPMFRLDGTTYTAEQAVDDPDLVAKLLEVEGQNIIKEWH